MTTTTELPIADAMTAAELLTGLRGLQAQLKSKAASVTFIVAATDAEPVYLSIRPDGYAVGAESHAIKGKTWTETFDAARQWIEQSTVVRRDTTIRKMALAIIELTDAHTKCTAEMLKRREFSAEQIEEFHEAACQRASEMCSNAPFVVVF